MTETLNKLGKSGFGRKNHLNNIMTLRENILTMKFKYDFLSYLTLKKLDIYIAQQCLYLEFTIFCNKLTLATLVYIKND